MAMLPALREASSRMAARVVGSRFAKPIARVVLAAAGLLLLAFSTWLVGPVHPYSYGLVFFLYSQMNILVHCGLDLRGPLAPFGFMARKHDGHHKHMKAGNFASITPLWDLVFRTAE